MTKTHGLLIAVLLFGILIELVQIRWHVRDTALLYRDSITTICYADRSSSTVVTCEVGTLSRERRIVPKNSNSNVTM